MLEDLMLPCVTMEPVAWMYSRPRPEASAMRLLDSQLSGDRPEPRLPAMQLGTPSENLIQFGHQNREGSVDIDKNEQSTYREAWRKGCPWPRTRTP